MSVQSYLKTGKQDTKQRALTALAAILGAKMGISVNFNSGISAIASTDGKTINLPYLPDHASEEDAVLVEGLMDHEACHVRFTDFNWMKSGDVVSELNKTPLLHSMWNVFEDVWIEREQAKIFPGCMRKIKESVKIMIDRKLYAGPKQGATEKSAASMCISYLLHMLLGRAYENDDLIGFGNQWESEFVKCVGDAVQKNVRTFALQVDQVTSSQQSYSLAKRILDLLPAQNQPKAEDEKGDNQDGQDDAGDDHSDAIDRRDKILESLDLSGGRNKNSHNNNPLGQPGSEYCKTVFSKVSWDASLVPAIRDQTKNHLGNILEEALAARTQMLFSTSKQGLRLKGSRLPGVSTGRFDVFECEEDVKGISSELYLLVDYSTSMNDLDQDDLQPDLIHKAVGSALGLGDVLHRLDLPFGYGSFSDFGRHHWHSSECSWPTKISAIVGESLRGQTNLSSGLFVAMKALLASQAERKVVVLITDGIPSQSDDAVNFVRELLQGGIEVASIFLDENCEPFAKMMGIVLARQIAEKQLRVQRAYTTDVIPKAIFEAIKSAYL